MKFATIGRLQGRNAARHKLPRGTVILALALLSWLVVTGILALLIYGLG